MSPVQPTKTRQRGAEGTQSASSDPLSLRSLRVGDRCVVTDGSGRRYATVDEIVYGHPLIGGTLFDESTGRSVFVVDHAGHAIARTVAWDAVVRVRQAVERAVKLADSDQILVIHEALAERGLL